MTYILSNGWPPGCDTHVLHGLECRVQSSVVIFPGHRCAAPGSRGITSTSRARRAALPGWMCQSPNVAIRSGIVILRSRRLRTLAIVSTPMPDHQGAGSSPPNTPAEPSAPATRGHPGLACIAARCVLLTHPWASQRGAPTVQETTEVLREARQDLLALDNGEVGVRSYTRACVSRQRRMTCK